MNHTRNIETIINDFYINSDPNPLYLYQKFSVRLSQYVHNISIFIRDNINENLYSEENSWEIAILNCSNDLFGTPNETIQESLMAPHPKNSIPRGSCLILEIRELAQSI